MKITFLGTGTSQGIPVIGCDCKVCKSEDPRDSRLRTSILISDEDRNIVIDVGPDFRQQMLTHKVDHLDAVLLTHEHNDHVVGIDDLRPYIFKQKVEMPIYATKRVNDDLRSRFKYAFSTNPYPGAPRLALQEITQEKSFTVAGFEVLPIEVMHGSLSILGFRVGSFTYITDANHISEQSLNLIRGTKVLIINSLHHNEHYSHFNLKQSLEVIEALKPDVCYLTHISHGMGPLSDWETSLPDNVFSGVDGMTIHL